MKTVSTSAAALRMRFARLEVVGNRFFEEHVFAGCEEPGRRPLVQVVGQHDVDGVEVTAFEGFVE